MYPVLIDRHQLEFQWTRFKSRDLSVLVEKLISDGGSCTSRASWVLCYAFIYPQFVHNTTTQSNTLKDYLCNRESLCERLQLHIGMPPRGEIPFSLMGVNASPAKDPRRQSRHANISNSATQSSVYLHESCSLTPIFYHTTRETNPDRPLVNLQDGALFSRAQSGEKSKNNLREDLIYNC
jgi:hypothetical protein